ncbi:MAG TPA: hypothetical protein VGC82_01665 [Rhodopila sp.]|jgi:hypothetical protein
MRKLSLSIVLSTALIFSLSLSNAVLADDAAESAKTRTSGSVKPGLGSGPAEQKSAPSSAPPATTTRTTGATDQSNTVKTMNKNENAKLDVEGK